MREPEVAPSEALLALAAICMQQGGKLSVEWSDMVSVPIARFVWQERLDGSGVDMYFFEEPPKKKKRTKPE